MEIDGILTATFKYIRIVWLEIYRDPVEFVVFIIQLISSFVYLSIIGIWNTMALIFELIIQIPYFLYPCDFTDFVAALWKNRTFTSIGFTVLWISLLFYFINKKRV
jgi:hypothetical protein